MSNGSYAISTTWNYSRNSDIKKILFQINDIGLSAIEIGYNFSAEKLKELVRLTGEMKIKVVSVHNFCPLPSEANPDRHPMDYYRLSSLNEDERKKAVYYTKGSIDTAHSVSAKVVIIHAGAVEIKDNSVSCLLNLYREGKAHSENYRQIKENLLAVRKKEIRYYLDSIARSLEEILAYASLSGIKIGLETRYYPNEIPNLEEAEYLLGLFKNRGLIYWHDIGHGEVNERLGITAHIDFLENLNGFMEGIHLHDLKGIDDHMAPFSGDIDFSKVIPYLHSGLIKVIEAHPPATPQQIKESIRRLSRVS